MPNIIKFSQVIYGYIAKVKEEIKKYGFQFICYTKDHITESDLKEIEALFYYEYDQTGNNQIKYLYYRLKSKKYIIGKVVPVNDVDDYGRKGLYFAHAIIIDDDEFKKVGYNPFIIFDCFEFKSSLNGVEDIKIKCGDNIGYYYMSIDDNRINKTYIKEEISDTYFDITFIKKMKLLLGISRSIKQFGLTIAMIGDSEDILKILKKSFMGLPESIKKICTFDSHSKSFTKMNLDFMIKGIKKDIDPRIDSCNVINVNVFELSIDMEINKLKIIDLFDKWWFKYGHALTDNESSIIGEEVLSLEKTFKLCDDNTFTSYRLNENVRMSIFDVGKEEISSFINRYLCKKYGNYMGTKLYKNAKAMMDKVPEKWFDLCIQLLDSSQINIFIEHEYRNDYNIKKYEEELVDLYNYLKITNLKWLKLRYLFWSKKWEELEQELEKSNDDEFSDFFVWAANIFKFKSEKIAKRGKDGINFITRIYCEAEKELGNRLIEIIFKLKKIKKLLEEIYIVGLSESRQDIIFKILRGKR